MRAMVLGLVLTLAAVPAIHAQHAIAAPPAEAAEQTVAEIRPGEAKLAPAAIEAVPAGPVISETVATRELRPAAREISARSALAIIGAIVIVAAIISLLT
jgi:hypothetical protein